MFGIGNVVEQRASELSAEYLFLVAEEGLGAAVDERSDDARTQIGYLLVRIVDAFHDARYVGAAGFVEISQEEGNDLFG